PRHSRGCAAAHRGEIPTPQGRGVRSRQGMQRMQPEGRHRSVRGVGLMKVYDNHYDNGRGDGNGRGYGSGSSDSEGWGDGWGCGWGSGSGDGYGNGSGNGSGWANGAGWGNGWGYYPNLVFVLPPGAATTSR